MIFGEALRFQLNAPLSPLGAGLQSLGELADVLRSCELKLCLAEGLLAQLIPDRQQQVQGEVGSLLHA